MIIHEMQKKCWVVVNTVAVWVHVLEKQEKERGAVKKKYKKGKEERKGVQPTGIVWLIQLSSKSQAAQTPNHTDLDPLCNCNVEAL